MRPGQADPLDCARRRQAQPSPQMLKGFEMGMIQVRKMGSER